MSSYRAAWTDVPQLDVSGDDLFDVLARTEHEYAGMVGDPDDDADYVSPVLTWALGWDKVRRVLRLCADGRITDVSVAAEVDVESTDPGDLEVCTWTDGCDLLADSVTEDGPLCMLHCGLAAEARRRGSPWGDRVNAAQIQRLARQCAESAVFNFSLKETLWAAFPASEPNPSADDVQALRVELRRIANQIADEVSS